MASENPSYGNDREQFIAAAAMATAAALVLREYPAARTIALAIGVCVSNPGGMVEAAVQWLAPSTGDGEVDFAGIKTRVVEFREDVQKKWEGPAQQTFDEALDKLLEQLDVAERHFNGVGDSMRFTAQLYHWAAQLAFALATLMTALAAIRVWTRLVPWVAVQIQCHILISAVLSQITPLARSLAAKLGKTVMRTTGIVAVVNIMCATMTQMLTKNRPKPDYAPTGVEYVKPKKGEAVGHLEHTNDGMPDTQAMAQGGGMMGGII
ncbi:hypothetical protein E1295_01545 [Nonomuraea mesophila]|uniref:WXG100 family type VII secretion target n=1 Tax=Nonomuraea mesophila TaxID=2530382 RepID=A0A4R5FYC5_9ACTN|nr:hypothetical protein [Nonomuraea mesophila]TDE59961.1 hypothetical protein E1295_01545 [Nonomuraea mesophila]